MTKLESEDQIVFLVTLSPGTLVVTGLNVIREERRDALEDGLHVPGS